MTLTLMACVVGSKPRGLHANVGGSAFVCGLVGIPAPVVWTFLPFSRGALAILVALRFVGLLPWTFRDSSPPLIEVVRTVVSSQHS